MGELDEEVWRTAEAVVLEYTSEGYSARPDSATTVRVLWSDDSLYIAWESPYTRLTVFDSPQPGTERFDMEKKGVSLWDRDVVEVMIASDPEHPNRYAEFEVAPTNEKLDLVLDLPKRDFAWSSGFQTAVKVDKKAQRWICEARIPMKALATEKPEVGAKWRVNFYRCDRPLKLALPGTQP